MEWLFYEIKEIPDISLAKYQSLGEQGVDGVLEKHNSFLRQWQRISLLCKLGVHLFILYDPSNPENQKIEIVLGFSFEKMEEKEKLRKIMKASPLSDYYSFCESDICLEKIGNLFFSYRTIIKKIERKRETEDENHISLFTVEGWESNEKGRLYDLMRSMAALNERAVYMVSLYGEEAYQEVLDALTKPITVLRKRIYGQDNFIRLKETQKNSGRDVAIEETLKKYEELLNTTSSSPCFYAKIQVLAENELCAQILLNAACSEAIQEGNCEVVLDRDKRFNVLEESKKVIISKLMPQNLNFLPMLFSLEEIAPFFRFPALYDGEFIEIKKETTPLCKNDGFSIGETLQKNKVFISTAALMKHAFVCGVPGAGKTNTMLHIADSLWNNTELKFGEKIKRAIPFLVFEPAKREYRELALFDIPELIIFSPSANTRFPLQLNPFEFPKGLTLSEHITRLRQVFEGAFPIQAPAPFILDQSIEAIYLKYGWKSDDINMGEKEYPTVSELYEEFQKQIQFTSYDSEIQGNIRSVLEMRIGSLIRREKKDIFDVHHSIISPEEWLEKPIILELEALGKETANFVTLLICTLIRETLKVNPMEGVEKREVAEIDGTIRTEIWKPLRHVIFIEEAHNLIATQSQIEANQESNPKIAATECIVDILKEVRALREGVIVADQLPTSMATDVIKNTNIKIVHRLTSGDDRGMIGSTMAANELQLEQMATYLPGQALMTYEGLLRPFQIQVDNLEKHGNETPDDTQLYEIMKSKPGQRNIYQRFESRKWLAIQKKVKDVFQLEIAYRKALRNYNFASKSSQQLEEFFEQCASKLQGLQLLRQTCLKEIQKLSFEYVGKESANKVEKIARSISEGYRQDVQFFINKYVE